MYTKSIQEPEFINLISKSRLNSYKFNDDEDFIVLLRRYIYNIQISESFYPVLSMLEIALRNRINNAIHSFIKKDWLLSEIKSQKLLLDNEYKILLNSYKKLKLKNKNITQEALISELSLGFWINLCKKAYKTIIWDKKGVFEFVFPNFPISKEMNRIRFISSDLKNILQLRNRIFHHEIIINHKIGVQNCYNIIEKILHYISDDYCELLSKVSRFSDIIKQKP
jgi:hypothetical protein